jgi:hypothetical protein
MCRAVRPGGRIVLADPDYSAQALDIGDLGLAAGVLRLRAETALRNGALAHQHPGMLAARGPGNVAVEARTLVVRTPLRHLLHQLRDARTGGLARAQPIPVTCSAVVQFVLMADRAAASVIRPEHTAFFSLVSTPSLLVAVGLP